MDFKTYYDPLPVGIAVFRGKKQIYENPYFEKVAESALLEYASAQESKRSLIAGIQERLAKDSWLIRRLTKSGQPDVFRVEVIRLKPKLNLVSLTALSQVSQDPLYRAGDRTSYIFNDLRIDMESKTLWVKKHLVHLSRLEYQLMEYLCRFEGKVVSKKDLLKSVWGTTAQDTRAVDMAISRLKKKLAGAVGRKPKILTLRGQGYVLSNS